MLTIFVAALLAQATQAEVDQLDQSMDAYQSCLVTNARIFHAGDRKLNPERAVAAASPACEPQAAKLTSIGKTKFNSVGGTALRVLDALEKAAVMRYRASQYIWDSRSQASRTPATNTPRSK